MDSQYRRWRRASRGPSPCSGGSSLTYTYGHSFAVTNSDDNTNSSSNNADSYSTGHTHAFGLSLTRWLFADQRRA